MPACSILVVDDEPGIRELLTLMLEAAGHSVITAEDGMQAPKVLANQSVDIVITDLLMPERDGLEFITEVRRKFPKVKIIAMSGGGHIARDSYLRIAKNFGAHVLLEKPFSQSGVLGAIDAVLATS
ncbi:MAG TPA: response regulator [Opitutaceae bacterium]|jgi:CheY-like chemotaxis protein|nr:response regulator [Opitutaceae bacterium]